MKIKFSQINSVLSEYCYERLGTYWEKQIWNLGLFDIIFEVFGMYLVHVLREEHVIDFYIVVYNIVCYYTL